MKTIKEIISKSKDVLLLNVKMSYKGMLIDNTNITFYDIKNFVAYSIKKVEHIKNTIRISYNNNVYIAVFDNYSVTLFYGRYQHNKEEYVISDFFDPDISFQLSTVIPERVLEYFKLYEHSTEKYYINIYLDDFEQSLDIINQVLDKILIMEKK